MFWIYILLFQSSQKVAIFDSFMYLKSPPSSKVVTLLLKVFNVSKVTTFLESGDLSFLQLFLVRVTTIYQCCDLPILGELFGAY